mgnify:CR=1 FL=1
MKIKITDPTDYVKTIDEWVINMLDIHIDDLEQIKKCCYLIVMYHIDFLIQLLKSESNKPSKYDIYIIQQSQALLREKVWKEINKKIRIILKIYSNRK